VERVISEKQLRKITDSLALLKDIATKPAKPLKEYRVSDVFDIRYEEEFYVLQSTHTSRGYRLDLSNREIALKHATEGAAIGALQTISVSLGRKSQSFSDTDYELIKVAKRLCADYKMLPKLVELSQKIIGHIEEVRGKEEELKVKKRKEEKKAAKLFLDELGKFNAEMEPLARKQAKKAASSASRR
jgi:hypothetical protein